MFDSSEDIKITRRGFIRNLGVGALVGQTVLQESAVSEQLVSRNTSNIKREKKYCDMTIPEDQLEWTIKELSGLAQMRTSNMFAEYEDEDIELVFFDMADAQKVKTVLDVIRFLRNQGQDHLDLQNF